MKKECTNLLEAERSAEARREWIRFSALDFKLGLRMLARYPGLTVVGGLAGGALYALHLVLGW